MAKATSKKKTTKKTAKKAAKKPAKPAVSKASPKRSTSRIAGAASGKHLVIVESPAKAKTINKYLGSDYVVRASVGHVRDLPTRAPKGTKQPVPGVDLEDRFAPSYEVLKDKKKVVTELKKLAKAAQSVWFATDLDREGEAIAWHLAQELGVDPAAAQRVVFNAITKQEIAKAFQKPLAINQSKVDAQQARRVLDRIVGYQVSPLLWKKVARGLSAGRVQSVACRVIVEREREIRAFVPDETWRVTGRFTPELGKSSGLCAAWSSFLAERDAKGNGPTLKSQQAWIGTRGGVTAELVGVSGGKFDVSQSGRVSDGAYKDLTPSVAEVAKLAGLTEIQTTAEANEDGKGPAGTNRRVFGSVDPSAAYRVTSIEKRQTRSRPSPPFITSTLQQAASSRLGFGAQRTMRTAQQLYEGIDLPGEGAVGLITYMRTDSTHLASEALQTARGFIQDAYGAAYLPDTPNVYKSRHKGAQEAHEAIRPSSVAFVPQKVRSALSPDQQKLYQLIWDRFIACQMVPAVWDATTALLSGGTDPHREVTFRATGRTLAFDGFYRASGAPITGDEQTLPALSEGQPLAVFSVEPQQRFSSPPSRYSEASLIKTLESEGIGRPSTYASIIQVIQNRKYVEQLERRFYATDLGEVVTDKLIEAFPRILDVGYTRDMESDLDKIEDDGADWVSVLESFYGPFKERLEHALENLTHAKAETQPAPKEYRCEKCGSDLVYRFGKNGRFLSCSTYPTCDYACPCDRDGKPQPIVPADVACTKCGSPMIKRTGRFGPFYGCSAYPECDGILKADKEGRPLAPQPPALATDLPCPKCGSHLVLRNGVRGPWLACSTYPKCRGRGKWSELESDVKDKWTSALGSHEKEHPIPIIRTMSGVALTDAKGKPLAAAEDAAESLPGS